jgi:hypothetical protein
MIDSEKFEIINVCLAFFRTFPLDFEHYDFEKISSSLNLPETLEETLRFVWTVRNIECEAPIWEIMIRRLIWIGAISSKVSLGKGETG